MATASKYRPRNNIAPPTGLMVGYQLNNIDSRQQKRHRLRKNCEVQLAQRYRRGKNTHQWPFEMPKRTRHLIIHRMMKQLVALHGLAKAASI